MGLSCEDCDDEEKIDRGCHLPGYNLKSLTAWRIDYHEPIARQDRCFFCPLSVFDESILEIVNQGLEIEKAGGPDRWTGKPLSEIPSTFLDFYWKVLGVRDRFQAEARDAFLQMKKDNSKR